MIERVNLSFFVFTGGKRVVVGVSQELELRATPLAAVTPYTVKPGGPFTRLKADPVLSAPVSDSAFL